MIDYRLVILTCSFVFEDLVSGGLEEVHNEQTELVSGGGGSSVDLPSLENCETAAVTAPQPQRISANPSPASVGSNAKVEPEKIRKWREEQKLLLEKKGFFKLEFFCKCAT